MSYRVYARARFVRAAAINAALIIGLANVGKLSATEQTAPLDAAALAAGGSEVLTQLGLQGGEFVDLLLPTEPFGTLEVSLPVGGRSVVLDIETHSLRARDFQLLVQVEDGSLVAVAPSPPKTYRGFVQGEPESSAAVSVIGGALRGQVFMPSDDMLYTIEPVAGRIPNAAPGVHVIYRDDQVQGDAATCGVDDDFLRLHPPAELGGDGGDGGDSPEGGGGTLRECQIAFDADFEFYELNGSSVDNTIDDIESVMNAIEAQYDRDVDVVYVITTIIVRSTSNDPYSFSNAGLLLDQFHDYWNANHAGVARDTAHLMTGRELDGTTVGVAYLGTVTIPTASYGLSQSRFTLTFSRRVDVTAHEVGHGWNANHCDDAGGNNFFAPCCNSPTYTMCSGIGFSVRNQFCDPTKDVIIAWRNSHTGGLPLAASELTLPFSDNFNSTSLGTDSTINANWLPLSGATVDGVATGEPSGGLSLRLNFTGGLATGGDELRSRIINSITACNLVLTFWYSRDGGGGDSPETGDDLFVEYLDNTLTWQIASQQLGSGPDMTSFAQVVTTLPSSAKHTRFRVRVRSIATGAGDDWFVDDLSVVDDMGGVVFIQNPQSQTACLNGIVTFDVVHGGTGPFTYQWRKNGVVISGATQPTYTIDPVIASSAGNYSVTVSNACSSPTSGSGTLTVNASQFAPTITTQPASQAICFGNPVTFSVVASGTAPLSYQWTKDGVNIPGATSSSYTDPSVQASDAGGYAVVVTNTCGSRTSQTATLTAMQAVSITTQPVGQTVCPGAPVSFSVVATGSPTITYQWRRNFVNIPGATSATYSIAAVQAADAGDYTVLVTNPCGTVGSAVATLTVLTQPSISVQPSPQTICVGDPVTFSVTAVGSAPLGYQWRKNGVNIGGATGPSYSIAAVQATDAGNYSVVVTNACGSATSQDAALTVETCTVNVDIVSASPPHAPANPFEPAQPYRDVLDTGTGPELTAGIGANGTPAQGGIVYAPISVTFSGTPSPAPTPANVVIACTGGLCPIVTGVTGSGAGPYQLTLDRAIPPGECTTITFAGTNAGQKLQYRSQPGNVSLGGGTNTQDLLAMISALNNGSANTPQNWARYNVDRNTSVMPVNTQDILRIIQLLNGINTTQSFNGASVAACP